MTPPSLQQQLLYATPPGRGSQREDFARCAPDYVLQYFVDKLRSDCEMVEKDTLKWITNNYSFSFSEHDTIPVVKARDYDLLNAITYSSDLIPHLWRFRLNPDDVARFIAKTVDDMRGLWGIPITRENVRARLVYLAIRRQRAATKEDYTSDLFGYVRENLSAVESTLEQIFEMQLTSVDAIKELINTHGAIRVGIL